MHMNMLKRMVGKKKILGGAKDSRCGSGGTKYYHFEKTSGILYGQIEIIT